MAFDLGFDFRATAGYVTDPAYGVPVLGETYPHTYTNGNGYSVNAGWDTIGGTIDRVNTNDPRIAGINYHVNDGNLATFTVDLSSGSAPGAGDYTVDLAVGDQIAAAIGAFKLFDNTTVLIDASAGVSTNTGEFIDATTAVVAASTTWTGTTVVKTFATTTVKLTIAYAVGSDYTKCNHFRLTAAAAATSSRLASMLTLLGVGT